MFGKYLESAVSTCVHHERWCPTNQALGSKPRTTGFAALHTSACAPRTHRYVAWLCVRLNREAHEFAELFVQAKGKTSEAITKLCQLAPPTALLLELDAKASLHLILRLCLACGCPCPRCTRPVDGW